MKTPTKKRKMVEVDTLVKKAEDLYVPLDFKKNHAYFSKADGTGAYHGVTSIIGKTLAKPALIGWASNTNTNTIKEKATYIKETDTYMVSGELLEEARTAHTRKKEEAGEAGSDVHSRIEKIVKDAIEFSDGLPNFDIADAEPNQVHLFWNWAKDNSVRFLESEKVVFSKESHYAGTCDLVLKMGDKKYIADVKTSSGIYPEAFLQMAAYQGALEEMGEHTDIAGAIVINLPKKGGFEIGQNYDYAGNRMAFLGLFMAYKQLNAIK